ncbi:MAG TPA: methyl-accepting chemotaxis protein [Rummeliibacillus sp.]|nr:methyl-accepting chemotaxis protein [Rummeliibacillus sp.]
MGKLKKLKISTKFNILVIGIILFLSISIGLVAKNEIENAMIKVFTDRVNVESSLGYNWLNEKYKGNWSIKNGELYKGDIQINNNNELVDGISEITNGAATIFQGDTRIATNVKKNGQRVIGTQADPKVTKIVLEKGKSYIGKANVVGEDYLTMYKPIKDQEGNVIGMWFVGSKIEFVNNTILSILISFGIVMAICGLIAVIWTILFTRRITRPILKINNQLREIADGEGDLTKELSVNSQDEVGELANSFNKMLNNLRTMIRQIGLTAEQMAGSSEELSASADQTEQATNQIATSIQEISTGAETQGYASIESSRVMQELTENIQLVAKTTSSVSESATETSKEADHGNESIQNIIQQMNTINESVENSASVVKQLGEHSKEIEKITEVIMEIADQTNLLALNAAIEAARAGEHGKGFAVVADEVRKLAEQSKESADQIASLIAQIQDYTTHAVIVMDKGTHEVAVGMNVVKDTGEGIKKVLSSIEQVASQIQEVSAVSEEMAASVEEANVSIEEMANIAQLSADSTQNVASASEEQLASIEEVATSSSLLSKMAEELYQLTKKFKV